MIAKVMRHRPVRYVISGIISFLVENATFMLMFYAVNLSPAAANVISIGVALLVNFFISKHFVFNDDQTRRQTGQQLLRYLVLVGFNLAVSTLLVSALIGHGAPGFLAKPAVTLGVATWTYLAYSRLIFKNKTNSSTLS